MIAKSMPSTSTRDQRILDLHAMLAASTNPDGIAKLGYRDRVAAIRAEIAALKRANAGPTP